MTVTVQRVLAPNPGLMTGTGTNTYLLDGGRGEVAVVDPGPDDPRHAQAILQTAAPLGRITSILVTHSHGDHLPAALPLSVETGAPLLGHRELPHVQQWLHDGEEREVAKGVKIEALDAPGHTDDSQCYWIADDRALFTGDIIAGAGSLIVDDAPGGLSRYMATLARLRALGSCRIYPGHGPEVADGLAKLEEYITHRSQREQQVVQALGSGTCTVQQLVSAIYTDVPTSLLSMAARNVRAHLDKLRIDGRAAERGGSWSLT